MDIPVTIDDGNKIIRVIIEKEYEILTIENEEAQKWVLHNRFIATLASLQGNNPFDHDSINWKIQRKPLPLQK